MNLVATALVVVYVTILLEFAAVSTATTGPSASSKPYLVRHLDRRIHLSMGDYPDLSEN